jgi:hypothetical protein
MCAYPPNEGGVGNTCNHYTTNKEGGKLGQLPLATWLINRHGESFSPLLLLRPNDQMKTASHLAMAVGCGSQPKLIAYIIRLSSAKRGENSRKQTTAKLSF